MNSLKAEIARLKMEGHDFRGEMQARLWSLEVEPAELRDAVAWYFECLEMQEWWEWSVEVENNPAWKWIDFTTRTKQYQNATPEVYESFRHAEQQLREMIGGEE